MLITDDGPIMVLSDERDDDGTGLIITDRDKPIMVLSDERDDDGSGIIITDEGAVHVIPID